jgi:putative hemolysin
MSGLALAAVLCVLGILLSGLFSGAETGAYQFNRTRHSLALAEGRRRAKLVEALTGDVTGFLVVCLVGTNLANSLVSYSATLAFTELEVFTPEFMATLIVGPVLFIFGEFAPKELFRRNADRLLYASAPLLRLAAFLLRPMTWAFGLLTTLVAVLGRQPGDGGESGQQRLRQAIGAALEGGTLTAYQATLARNIFSMRSRRVRHAMIPLAQVDVLAAGTTVSDAREIIRDSPRGRYPVYGEDRRQVVGIVDLYDLLFGELDATVSEFTRAALAVAPTEKVAEALVRMRRKRVTLAVVVGHDGVALGIITLKDLVEEITGELHDL